MPHLEGSFASSSARWHCFVMAHGGAGERSAAHVGQPSGERGEGAAALPGNESHLEVAALCPIRRLARIEQPAGRDWRDFRKVTLRWIGGFVIIGILAVLVVFYLWRGMVKIESGRSGRTIVRFNGFERFVHWMTATCFIILALSRDST